MAEKDIKKAAPEAKKTAPRKKSGKFGFFVIALVAGASLLFIMPTFILVVVGLIPTIVALITDDDKEKSSAIAIGALNCVGLMPFVIDLWTKGQTINMAFSIMSDMTTWVVIFGAAGIGKLIIFVVPQATASITLANAERRLKVLNDNLVSLKTAWGPDVATTKPLNSLSREE